VIRFKVFACRLYGFGTRGPENLEGELNRWVETLPPRARIRRTQLGVDYDWIYALVNYELPDGEPEGGSLVKRERGAGAGIPPGEMQPRPGDDPIPDPALEATPHHEPDANDVRLCRSEIASGVSPHGVYRCRLPRGHKGEHKGGGFAWGWVE